MDANSFWEGRTAYQIVPDRFCRKGAEPIEHINGRKLKNWQDRMPDWEPDDDGEYRNLFYYGGNLKGIEEKLPYFKEMGFDTLYLTPIEQSKSYHHYDVGNHEIIDPWLGKWEDFRALCTKAKQFGIAIIVDLVFNHTGIDSIYYKNPKYQNWYKKDKQTGEQVFWCNFLDMPECNTMLIEYQEAMLKNAERYIENGASGFRFDLGENLPKEFLHAMAKIKEKYPTCIFIGEMWNIATDKPNNHLNEGCLDSVMNYPLSDAILRWTRWGKDKHFSYNFNRVYGEYPQQAKNILLNNIGTHDTPTTITMLTGDKMNDFVFNGNQIWNIEQPWRYGDNEFDTYGFRQYEANHDSISEEQYVFGKNLLKIALTLLYSIPGIPCVYQGTEVLDSGYKDPFNRKPYPWEKGEREMRFFIKELGAYRKQNIDILARGEAKILRITDSILILERKLEKKRIIVALNRVANPQKVNLHEYMENPKILLETNGSSLGEINAYGIVIAREN